MSLAFVFPGQGSQAVGMGKGLAAMEAPLGLDFDSAAAVGGEAGEGQICQAATGNGAGKVLVSRDRAAVADAVEIADQKGVKRKLLLTVPPAFHCTLVQRAAA